MWHISPIAVSWARHLTKLQDHRPKASVSRGFTVYHTASAGTKLYCLSTGRCEKVALEFYVWVGVKLWAVLIKCDGTIPLCGLGALVFCYNRSSLFCWPDIISAHYCRTRNFGCRWYLSGLAITFFFCIFGKIHWDFRYLQPVISVTSPILQNKMWKRDFTVNRTSLVLLDLILWVSCIYLGWVLGIECIVLALFFLLLLLS